MKLWEPAQGLKHLLTAGMLTPSPVAWSHREGQLFERDHQPPARWLLDRQVVAVFQDLAQVRRCYVNQANTILTNFHAKILMAGTTTRHHDLAPTHTLVQHSPATPSPSSATAHRCAYGFAPTSRGSDGVDHGSATYRISKNGAGGALGLRRVVVLRALPRRRG